MKKLLGLAILACLALALGGCFDANEPPLASFTRSPAAGVAPLAVFFDASASADPDGSIVAYSWDFGDSSAIEQSGSGATATHTFATPGTYSVTLRVTDDGGKSAESIRAVDVSDSDASPSTGTEVGQRAPEIQLADARTGKLRTLFEFRGYVVLLEFWRSTCSACRTSMPNIEALRAKHADEGLVVVLISEDTAAEDARAVLDEQGYDEFVALYDADGDARAVYDIDVIPRTFVIDRQGIVRYEDHPIRIRDRNITPWL